MLKDDTVYLRGIIKHRSLNESQKGKKRRNEYYIDHVLISKVEQNKGFFQNIRRKIDSNFDRIENKDEKYMGFVYALLFGDRSRLDVQEVKLFKEPERCTYLR